MTTTPPADQQLRDRVEQALRTAVSLPTWPPLTEHGRHDYELGCALCHGDVAILTNAVLAVVQPELDPLAAALEVATTQHAKAIAARDRAQTRAKTSDDIATAEREVFRTAIRELGGDPVQVQNLYAQLTSRTRQWKEAEAELDRVRAEHATARKHLDALAVVKVWRNESGREFLFADDVRTAVGVPAAPVAAVPSA